MRKIKNNLFDFATKELSQDAIICWLINCFNSENKEIGDFFIKNFIFKGKKGIEIDYVEKPIRQKHKIDICFKVSTNIGRFIILIEDKKGTFLRNSQLEDSIKKISKDNKENDKIIYLLFKSTNILCMEEKIYEDKKAQIKAKNNCNMEFELRDANDMIKALKDNTDNLLLQMVFDYYKDIINQNKKSTDWKTEMNYEQWNTFYSQLNNELKSIDIFLTDEGQPQRSEGSSQREYRSHYCLPKKIENKLDNVVKGARWELIIDWYTCPQIMLYCDVSENGYKPYKEFSQKEKNKAQQRKKIIAKINKKLKEIDKNNMRCFAKDNAIGVIKKQVIELSQIVAGIKEILEIIENI